MFGGRLLESSSVRLEGEMRSFILRLRLEEKQARKDNIGSTTAQNFRFVFVQLWEAQTWSPQENTFWYIYMTLGKT